MLKSWFKDELAALCQSLWIILRFRRWLDNPIEIKFKWKFSNYIEDAIVHLMPLYFGLIRNNIRLFNMEIYYYKENESKKLKEETDQRILKVNT